MQLWKSILAYDGTHFHGWQVQPGFPTVQGTLAQALHHITGETVLPQGSGRTDTGVHALAQVATFALAAPIPPRNLHRALNRALPPSIRIVSVTHAPENFHARHSALRKTYEYRLFPRVQPGHPDRICPPFLAPYAWDFPFPFNLEAAQQAASHILGTHDFTSFAASDPDLTTRSTAPEEAEEKHKCVPHDEERSVPHPSQPHRDPGSPPSVLGSVGWDEWDPTTNLSSLPSSLFPLPSSNTRTIHHSTWTHHEGLYLYRVTGSGFLHHMVRNLVGTFTDVAAGRLSPGAISQILAARARSAAGPTAPARGLFLVEVEYPEVGPE